MRRGETVPKKTVYTKGPKIRVKFEKQYLIQKLYIFSLTALNVFQFLKTAVTYQNGPSRFVVIVMYAPDFGLLHFMTVDPTPQLMGQPVNQS